jgi:hypothetical protein
MIARFPGAPRLLVVGMVLALLLALAGGTAGRPTPLRAATVPAQPRADYSVADIYGCTAASPPGTCDQLVQGLAPTLDLIFPGPGDYQLAQTGSSFQLVFAHSAVLLPDLSTLTIYLNGQQLPSGEGAANALRLDAGNKTITTVTFPLPADRILPGYNDVQLRFYQRFREPCDDPGNPALISTVYETTRIHYEYAPGYPLRANRPPLNLGDFPYPFFRAGWTRAGGTDLVVPANPSRAELSAAATLAASFGAAAGSQPLALNILTADKADGTALAGNDVIAIGTPARNPLVVRITRGGDIQVTPDGQGFVARGGGAPLDPALGVLVLATSPFDGARVALVISGGNDDAVLRATLALSDRRARAALAGTGATISQPSDLRTFSETQPAATLYHRTFTDFGLSDQTFNISLPGVPISAGGGTVSTSFWFDGPAPAADQNATLNLVLSHPNGQSLDYNRSTVKAVVNGVNAASGQLDDATVDHGTLALNIRGDALKPGYNQVQLLFTLVPNTSARTNSAMQCAPDERTWLSVWSSSSLDVPSGPPPQTPDLAYYPFPYLYLGSMAGTYVVTGDSADALQNAVDLVADIGRKTRGATGIVNMIRAADLSPQIQQRANLLVVGLPSQQQALYHDINPLLPLQFVLDQNGAISDRIVREQPQVVIAARDHAQLGIVETIPSPYNAGHVVTLVTGTTPDGVALARAALNRANLSSNVLIVGDRDKPPSALMLAAKQTAASANAHRRSSASQNALPIITAIFVIGALALVGYWIYAASRNAQEGS